MLKSIDMSHLVERLVHRPSVGLAEGMMLAAVGASVSPRPGTWDASKQFASVDPRGFRWAETLEYSYRQEPWTERLTLSMMA